MSNVAIKVEGLGKRYKIGKLQRRHDTLRDRIADARVFNMFKRRNGHNGNLSSLTSDLRSPTSDSGILWALKDVSFEVKRGEVIGVIGRNGAGKSTLLKILSRITEPTEGYADINGRVASLLEVGTGFNSELTGRENIYLNGSILGMKRADIQRKFDEIVAFAEVEMFIDTPVKRYSSGMYLRLAFAVAAHLEPEILVVDEVLSVGDAAFQDKCLWKMQSVAVEGRTILLVSHNMSTIQQLCGRCILIRKGQIEKIGESGDVIGDYLVESKPESSLDIRDWQDRKGSGEARLVRLAITAENGSPSNVFLLGDTICFHLEAEIYEPITNPCFGVVVHGPSGEPILDLQSAHNGLRIGRVNGQVKIKGTVDNIGLYPGRYFLSPWITDSAVQRSIDLARMCSSFQIAPRPGAFGDLRLDPLWGKYWVESRWTTNGLSS